jgi:hypothetical protein
LNHFLIGILSKYFLIVIQVPQAHTRWKVPIVLIDLKILQKNRLCQINPNQNLYQNLLTSSHRNSFKILSEYYSSTTAVDYMKRAMERLEKALFKEGLEDVSKSLEIMGQFEIRLINIGSIFCRPHQKGYQVCCCLQSCPFIAP